MFERFTDSARRVMALAQESAKGLGHGFIGGEHLLLGIAEEEGGAGQRVLSGFATARLLRHEVADLHLGIERHGGHIPFTPSAKHVLELAHSQSEVLGVEVDSAVLLLGVLDERGTALNMLQNAGVDLDALRRATLDAVTGGAQERRPDSSATADASRCPACKGALRDHLRVEHLAAGAPDGPDLAPVRIAYCAHCGSAIGATFAR